MMKIKEAYILDIYDRPDKIKTFKFNNKDLNNELECIKNYCESGGIKISSNDLERYKSLNYNLESYLFSNLYLTFDGRIIQICDNHSKEENYDLRTRTIGRWSGLLEDDDNSETFVKLYKDNGERTEAKEYRERKKLKAINSICMDYSLKGGYC